MLFSGRKEKERKKEIKKPEKTTMTNMCEANARRLIFHRHFTVCTVANGASLKLFGVGLRKANFQNGERERKKSGE